MKCPNLHGSKRPMFFGILCHEMKIERLLETSGSGYAVMQRLIPEEWKPTPTYFDTRLCDHYLTKCENQTSLSTQCNIYTEITFQIQNIR
jgi:hypothetical protein